MGFNFEKQEMTYKIIAQEESKGLKVISAWNTYRKWQDKLRL